MWRLGHHQFCMEFIRITMYVFLSLTKPGKRVIKKLLNKQGGKCG